MRELVAQKRFNDAISASTSILGKYKLVDRYPMPDFFFALAQTYEALGLHDHAARAYRFALLLGDGELITTVPLDKFFPAYIRFLVGQGRHEMARDVYYIYMSLARDSHGFPGGIEYLAEPFPVLVIFDPDPFGDVWSYKPERLLAAVKICEMRTDLIWQKPIDVATEVRAMFPEWYVPVAILAFSKKRQTDETAYSLAQSLCRTAEERKNLAVYRTYHEATNNEQASGSLVKPLQGKFRREDIAFLNKRSYALFVQGRSSKISCGFDTSHGYREIEDAPFWVD